MFLDSQKSIIGLDIGPQKIVAVSLKKIAQGLVICQCAMMDTPDDAIREGVILDPKRVGEAIRKLFAKNNIKIQNVIAGCGGPGVILHLSKLPSISGRELKEAIKAQITKFVVFAGFSTVSDHHVVETFDEAGAKRIKVLIVASKKAILDSCLATIREAGLNLISIDENSLAATRALYENFSHISSKEAVIAVMVGFENTIMSIYQGNQLYYIHKMDSGIQSEADLKNFLSKFISEMDNVLQYCRTQFETNIEVKNIILGGEVEGLARLKKAPGEKLTVRDIPIEIVDPLKHISFQKQKNFDGPGYVLTRAIGLALKGMGLGRFSINIDLLPTEAIKLGQWNKRLKSVTLFLAGLVVLVAVAFVTTRISIRMINDQINGLSTEAKTLPLKYAGLLDSQQKSQKGMTEMGIQDKIFNEVALRAWDEVLEELRTIIPKDVRLIDFSANSANFITLSGEAISQEVVFNFERVLKESPYFENIKLGVIQSKQGPGDYVRFTISSQLRAEENPSQTEQKGETR